MSTSLAAVCLALAWALLLPTLRTPSVQAAEPPQEIREHQGRKLAAFARDYDNSIKGPQKVDPQAFRLKIHGLVDQPQSLTYDQVLALPPARRVATMPCVEGWSEVLLYDGVRIMDLLARAGLKPRANNIIFRSADGYSTSLRLDYIQKKDALLGYRINGLVLDAKRGFPFQVVAEHQLGYKWAKWVVEIEASDQPFRGYWEQRGYPEDAHTDR